ncbi:hypothetical protein [Paenibacillus sp. KS-LC4]|uniref:hypothetical protein n=1 Tax=Paenibacillus sp. KS-LC4 TaxID=2979727 RepID=UPI0030CD3C6E
MRKYLNLALSLAIFLLFIVPSVASANQITLQAVLPEYYPGSNVIIKTGDVLYSSKTFGTSTQIVGHIAIVASDMRVYHVNPADDGAGSGGKADALYNYFGRHGKGETIKVYRAAHGSKAAAWAKDNYNKVTNYSIPIFSWNDFKLGTINPNYCSKFIWQAFYYGNSNTDYIIGYYTPSKEAYVTPAQIIDSSDLTYAGSFITP